MQCDRKQLFAQCLMLPLVSIWLAKILCCIINGEPSWYSANQWENLRRWKNIWFAASYPSLSYADSVNFKAFLLWYWSTKWVCFPNCILIYSITSWVYKEYPSFSKVFKKKGAGQKDRTIQKKNPSFMISSASLSLRKMQFWVTRDLSAQQSLQCSMSTKHKRQQNAWYKWRAS